MAHAGMRRYPDIAAERALPLRALLKAPLRTKPQLCASGSCARGSGESLENRNRVNDWRRSDPLMLAAVEAGVAFEDASNNDGGLHIAAICGQRANTAT